MQSQFQNFLKETEKLKVLFFKETDKRNLKFIWKWNRPRLHSKIMKKKKKEQNQKAFPIRYQDI